ncbi:BCL5p [Paraphaeosphaeria sporulosa]
MTFLQYILGTSPTEPSIRISRLAKDDDEIYPVHTFDDPGRNEVIVTSWTMRFNDVLDKDKLHKSLAKLLEIGDWRKAGGRLRQKGQGQLEIYTPRTYTAERPPLSFTSQTYNMAIEDHPLAARLPAASEKPHLHPAPEEFREFAAPPGAPETLDNYLAGDIPMISLHVTSFQNATLVGIAWPHTLMDVMGQQALLRAWSLVLAGRMSEVPPMLGAREDFLIKAADKSGTLEEDYVLKPQIMKTWALVKVLLNLVWDLCWYKSAETRTIFLPKRAVANLRLEAQRQLPGEEEVSENDVLTAWTIRAVASALPKPRSITAVHALNARFRLRSLVDAPGIFVQNMVVAAFTFVEHSIAIGPLGPIARLNRQHLRKQATEAQILANLRELRKQPPGRVDPVSMICGDPDALLMPFTNWSRADLIHAVDFGDAVLKVGDHGPSRINPPGTFVYHHAAAMKPNPAARNFIMVLGQDHGGNQWITGILLRPAWAKIEEELRKM